MQIKQIALATLAVVAVAQAQAVTRVSGASATSIAYVEALATNNSCPSNNVSIYKRGTSSTTLGNNFTVKCNSGNFAGTTENEVQFDVSGGSLSAILTTIEGQRWEGGTYDGRFLSSTINGCTFTKGEGLLRFLSGDQLAVCSEAAPLDIYKSVGGFMSFEPSLFQAQGVLGSDYMNRISSANFSQVFGVAVSRDLYEALQADQGLIAGSTTPANQPNISRAQIVSMINSVDFNDAKNKGPKFLVPSTARTNITYCRQSSKVDTQAVAELYFLQNPSASGVLGGLSHAHAPAERSPVVANNTLVVNNGTGNTFTVKVRYDTADVASCLNAPGFAFGVLSATENPLVQANQTYRFVKLNGQEFSEGFAGATQKAAAITGKYDFVFEGALFNPTNSAVLDLINSRMSLGGYPGLFLNINSLTPDSKFTRGGSSVNAYQSY